MQFRTHICGGFIRRSSDHTFCDKCHAFVVDQSPDAVVKTALPTGTDVEANRDAWVMGLERSPDAPETAYEPGMVTS